MRRRWPKSVPVLSAGDIHRGDFDGPGNTRCLYGWAKHVFGPFRYLGPDARRDRVDLALKTAVGHRRVANFNDKKPRAAVANAWNRAMRSLGYTEIEDA